jgi:hypothetical protein
MEKIDWVSAPDIDGMTWQEAARSLQKHSFESAQRIMALTNELIDLKHEVERLKRGY